MGSIDRLMGTPVIPSQLPVDNVNSSTPALLFYVTFSPSKPDATNKLGLLTMGTRMSIAAGQQTSGAQIYISITASISCHLINIQSIVLLHPSTQTNNVLPYASLPAPLLFLVTLI